MNKRPSRFLNNLFSDDGFLYEVNMQFIHFTKPSFIPIEPGDKGQFKLKCILALL